MAPTAELTETPTSTVIFMARRRALTLVRKPERTKYADGTGERIVVAGERHEFVNGRLEASDPDLVAWLRAHPLLNNAESGFFELQVDIPAPVEELRELAMAGAQGNAAAVHDILERERAGHQRDLVIDSCLAALEELKLAAEAVPAASTEAPPEAPAVLPAYPPFGMGWPGGGE